MLFKRSRYCNRAVTYSNRTGLSILKATSIHILNFIHNNNLKYNLRASKIQIFLGSGWDYFVQSQDINLTPSIAHLPASLFMNLCHLYHQRLSLPAFCTFCNCVPESISHTWQCTLFTGMLARSFRCAIKPFLSIFNPLHSGLSILKTFSIIFTKMEAGYFFSKTVLVYNDLYKMGDIKVYDL